jgi:hypothetical protein
MSGDSPRVRGNRASGVRNYEAKKRDDVTTAEIISARSKHTSPRRMELRADTIRTALVPFSTAFKAGNDDNFAIVFVIT